MRHLATPALPAKSKLCFDGAVVRWALCAVVSASAIACGETPVEYSATPLRINELSPVNKTWQDELGNFGAWLELYNTATKDFDLNGCYLSNGVGHRFKFAFPEGVVVPAHEVLLVWADKKSDMSTETAPHVDFKIHAENDGVWLSDPSGYLVDSVEYANLPPNDAGTETTSLARFPDGTGEFQWCSVATPSSPNGRRCSGQAL